jgi:hypothetical protein
MPPAEQKSDKTPDSPPDEKYMSRAEVEALLAEREEKANARVARARASVPQALVPAHGGGPGVDQHQRSWSQAEQEAAQRGEVLDHWEVDD